MEIRYNNCEYGIGIRIIGGIEYNDKFYNIYIREVLQEGLAYNDGRLSEGDQLLAINDVSCINIIKEKAIELLRNSCATGTVKLLIKKYEDEDNEDFIELLELEKLINIGSDDEEDDEDVEGEDEDGLLNKNTIITNNINHHHHHNHNNHHHNNSTNTLLHSEIDLEEEEQEVRETEEEEDDETKLYDENDDKYNTNEISDSASVDLRNSNVQKLMTSQYLNSDSNLNYQSNSDQYFMRANKASLLEQQYMNMNVESYHDKMNDIISYNQEREALIDEIKRLQNELNDRDKSCLLYKDQLFELQQKVCEYLNEIMQLRSQLSTAEECQKEAIKIEQEYKQIIKFLKLNLNKTTNNNNNNTSTSIQQ